MPVAVPEEQKTALVDSQECLQPEIGDFHGIHKTAEHTRKLWSGTHLVPQANTHGGSDGKHNREM